LCPKIYAAHERCAGEGNGKNPAERFLSYDEFIMALTAGRVAASCS